MAQYRKRDPQQTLFQFKKRALVHFAVDPDQVYMTTRLAGKDTVFLPFNRGANTAGPATPSTPAATARPTCGRRSGSGTASSTSSGASSTSRPKRSKVDGKTVTNGDHDLPALPPARRGAEAGESRPQGGAGKSYLIQHSAGSGKVELHRVAGPSARQPARRRRPEGLRLGRGHHRPPRPRPAAPGHHLPVRAQAGRRRRRSTRTRPSSPRRSRPATPIIITTLQKFPFVTEKIGELPKRRYAP